MRELRLLAGGLGVAALAVLGCTGVASAHTSHRQYSSSQVANAGVSECLYSYSDDCWKTNGANADVTMDAWPASNMYAQEIGTWHGYRVYEVHNGQDKCGRESQQDVLITEGTPCHTSDDMEWLADIPSTDSYGLYDIGRGNYLGVTGPDFGDKIRGGGNTGRWLRWVSESG